jgi:GxxExxY protein
MKHENEISYCIRRAIFQAYNDLGPGLFESVYEAVIAHLLIQEGLSVKMQVPLPVIYNEIKMEVGFRIDLLVNDLVIIEIKSVDMLGKVHHKQLLTYLKLSGKKLGLLVNFNTDDIAKSIHRLVNNL